jgi:hypothetical protein
MEDWDTYWKIPSTDIEKQKMKPPEVEDIPSGEEEEEEESGNYKGNTVQFPGIRGNILTKENQYHRERKGRM